jgi:Neuraminidase (sialidase)
MNRTVNISSFLILALMMLGCNRRDESLVIHPADSPATGDSREPELTTTAGGRIILSWVEKVGEKRYALRMATRDQASWTQPRTVGEGENWFVNWADFPSVISLNNDSLAAHWLVKSGAATYAYNVNISLSNDGGNTWSKPIIPHLDNTPTEHGFVSLVTAADV